MVSFSAKPTHFARSQKTTNMLVNALQRTYPTNLKKSKIIQSKIRKSLLNSIEHNNINMTVTYLDKNESVMEKSFYAPNSDIVNSMKESDQDSEWCDSSELKSFVQNESKHQLFICKETNEVVFFIPSLSWQQKVFSDNKNSESKLKDCLIKSFKGKPNQINKRAKKRKIIAKKWIFFGKFQEVWSQLHQKCSYINYNFFIW